MKVTGLVLKIDTSQKDRAIKIDVQGAAKSLWVSPELHPQIRDLKEGQEACFEVADTMRWYYVFRSWERASAPNALSSTSESPTQTEQKGPKPPKLFTPTREKDLPPTSGKGRACSARFMAKFQELVAKELSVEELVDQLCLQESEIYQLKQALEVKQKIEEKVHTCGLKIDTDFDTIRPSHYVRIARVPDEQKQLELACKVAEEHLSVRELDKEIEGPKPPPPPREEAIDTGPWTCPICHESKRLRHLPNGKHDFENVEVVER